MQLRLSTWPEVEAYLARSRTVVLPVGSTEQHGPTGVIGTDAICAEAVANALGDATGSLVAPCLPIGMAQHHMGFPGTITLLPSTLIAVVRDCVQSLARHGFERFFVVNGHGGNIASLQAAFSELHAAASVHGGRGGLRFALHNWWATPAVEALSRQLYGDKCGAHATPPEVALTQHVHPDARKQAPLGPLPESSGGFGDGLDYRRRFPDGRIGSDPSLATPEAGARLLAAAVADLAAQLERFAAEP